MIVKLTEDYTYRGVKFKEGQKIVMPRVHAIPLCEEGIAISNEDIPCAKRQKKAAKDKAKKKKKTPKTDGDLDINNQL